MTRKASERSPEYFWAKPGRLPKFSTSFQLAGVGGSREEHIHDPEGICTKPVRVLGEARDNLFPSRNRFNSI